LKIKPVEGSGLTRQQIKELASILKASDNAELARSLDRAYDLVRSRQQLTRVFTRAGLFQINRAPALEASPLRARIEKIAAARPAARAARAERGKEIEYLRLLDKIKRAKREGRGERPSRAERQERISREDREERLERAGPLVEKSVKPVRPVRPARPVRPERPIRPDGHKNGGGERIKLERAQLPRQADSLITWRQGAYYVTVVPPFRTTGTKPDVIYSRHRPPWAKRITGKRSPQRTLKSIGKVPKRLSVPMGIVTARVKNGKKLRFISD